MHAVSFDKEMLTIIIHNQYPDLELTSPVYFSDGTTCHLFPDQKADIGTTTKASFGIGSKQKEFKGALLYKLRRKYSDRTDNLPNNHTISTKKAKNTHLLITWDIFDIEGQYHSFYACLIECDADFTWDENKLWALRYQYMDYISEEYNYLSLTWLTNDGAVVRMRDYTTYGLDCKLNIVITKGTGKYNLEKPMKFAPERLVVVLSMLPVLMYTVSFSIESLFKLNIHNQCLNIDLVSPTYINANKSECYRPPKYKVCANDTMRSAFIIESDDVFVCGVLICKLQKRQTHESTEFGEDASSSVYLSVIWGTFKSKLYIDVLLVEHDKGFDWNRNDLVKLDINNSDRFRHFSESATEIWSLDDNTTLMTTLEIINEDRTLNVTVSEVKRGNNARIPVHVDLER
jgi:hypothetical protein